MFKRQNISKLSVFALVAYAFLSATSCKKALDILPEDKLDKKQVYNTIADADAVVLGIYGQVATLGEKYIVLNELRADLMDVTSNADVYLQQVSNHEVTEDNPYADPADFYRIILNCNDAIKNFKIMADKSILSQDEYRHRVSDITALRTWLYLQLGIHYGAVPYVKNAIETVEDLKASDNYPKIKFEVLIDSLINDMNSLPYLHHYAYPTTSSLNFTVDGANTRKIFINKPHVLGELYLWKGDYYNAARAYKMILSAEDENANINLQFNNNRITYNDGSPNYSNLTISFDKSQEAASLVNSTTTGWRSIFALPNTANAWNTEWNWGIPYNNSYAPGNPFVELASKNGKYKVKPSKRIIDLWKSQILTNGVPGDARGTLSYSEIIEGEPVITKLTDAQSELSMLNRGGQWNIFRAAGAHLRFAEAANRDGAGMVAYALLNNGIRGTFYDGAYNSNGAISPVNFEEFETMITYSDPGTHQARYTTTSPYYFDARYNQFNNILYGVWYRNIGIRGRAMMPRIEFSGISYKDVDTRRIISDFNVAVEDLEDKIIEEVSLELAFEGARWSDLARIAIRRNDNAFLADKVYDKLLKANNPKAEEVRAKLMDRQNWYLPFKWK